MVVRFVTTVGVEACSVEQLPDLLTRADGFVWVDVPAFDDASEQRLAETFAFHDLTLRACRERNHVPATHAYPGYLFVVLHAPETGGAGHVHLLELDQFVGDRYLVTVHGPLNPEVPGEHALTETRAALRRVEEGRLRPATPADLSYAIVSALARRLVALTGRGVNPEAKSLLEDLGDQFERVRSLSDGEKEFLFGVIDLYQTRVATRMTVAVERLAVLAAVTLPVTAVASVYGMNVIVNESTNVTQLLIVLTLMLAMSGILLHWTKRQGWW